LAWITSWPVFEIVPTKLPHYILPLYPALAMMVAAFVMAPREQDLPAWRRRALPAGSALHFLVGAGLLCAAIVYLPKLYGAGTSWDLMAAAAVVAVLSLAAIFAVWRDAKPAAASFAVLASVATLWAATLDVLPRLDQLMVSPREARMIADHIRPIDPPVVLAGYTEPSAMFLIGTQTRLTNGDLAAQIGAAQGGLVAVEDGQRPHFLARLAEMEADAKPIDAVSGFNYSRGRPVHITLYRVTAAPQTISPPEE
jgi:4-amino-4-deoxy-L-arabinose transferase-like glycosyltransferase